MASRRQADLLSKRAEGSRRFEALIIHSQQEGSLIKCYQIELLEYLLNQLDHYHSQHWSEYWAA